MGKENNSESIDSKSDFKKLLDELEDFTFNYIIDSLSISSTDRDEQIDQIVENYTEEEIEDLIEEANTVEIELTENLESLDEDVFDLVCESLECDLDEEKGVKIDYIINKHSKEKTEGSIYECEYKSELMKDLEDLDERSIELIGVHFNADGISSREHLIEYIFETYSLNQIKTGLDITDRKISYYNDMLYFEEDVFSYLCFSFDVNDNILTREDKAYYLISRYSPYELDEQVLFFNNKLDLFNQLNSLDDALFAIVVSNMDCGYDCSKLDMIYKLMTNYSEYIIYIEVDKARHEYEMYSDLIRLDDSDFLFLVSHLKIPYFMIDALLGEAELDLSKFEESVSEVKLKDNDELSEDKDLDSISEDKDLDSISEDKDLNSILGDKDLSPKEAVTYYIIKNRTYYEIAEGITYVHSKRQIFEKLYNLDKDVMEIILKDLGLASQNTVLSDAFILKCINQLIFSYSNTKIDIFIKKAYNRLDFISRINDLNDVEFSFICKSLSVVGDSKEEKLSHIAQNYSDKEIKNELEIYKSFVNRLNNEDEIIFNRVFDSLIPEGEDLLDLSKDEKINYLIQNYTIGEIVVKMNSIKSEYKFMDSLNSLDDEIFDFLAGSLQVPKDLSKDKKIDHLISNYSSNEISIKINDAKTKRNFIHELNDLNEDLFYLMASKLSVPDDCVLRTYVTDYLVKNYPISTILLSLKEAKEEMDCVNKLKNLSDEDFEKISETFSLPDGLNRNEKIEYLIKMYPIDSILSQVRIAELNLDYRKILTSLDDDAFEYMMVFFDVSPHYISKEEKVNYIINNYPEEEIASRVGKFKENLDFIYEMDGDSYYILVNSLELPDDLKENFKAQFRLDKPNETYRDVNFYLLSAYGIDDLTEKYKLIYFKLDHYKLLNGLDDYLLDALIGKFSIEADLDTRFEKIDYLVSNFTYNFISYNLKEITRDFDYVSEALQDDEMLDNISSHFNLPDELSKEDKIKYLFINVDINRIKLAISYYGTRSGVSEIFNGIGGLFGGPKKNRQCPKCGYKIRSDDKFCPNCGEKLSITINID